MSGNLFTILVLSEILVGLLVLTVFLYFRWRKTRQQLLALQANNQQPRQGSWLDQLDQYIQTQQQQLDSFNQSPDSSMEHARRVFDTRIQLLTLEKQIAERDEAEKTPGYWQSIHKQLIELQPGYQQAREETGEDRPDNTALLKQQEKTISHLKEFINRLLSGYSEDAIPNKELEDKFEDIEKANRELEQCVMILEDENAFLRAQVAALLKPN